MTLYDRDICISKFFEAFIHNNQGMETNQVSTNGWMAQENVVYIYNEKLFNLKKKEILFFMTTGMNLQGISQWNKSEEKTNSAPYHILCMWDPKFVLNSLKWSRKVVVKGLLEGGWRMEIERLERIQTFSYKINSLWISFITWWL